MLVHRLRRWPSIATTVVSVLLFSGMNITLLCNNGIIWLSRLAYIL